VKLSRLCIFKQFQFIVEKSLNCNAVSCRHLITAVSLRLVVDAIEKPRLESESLRVNMICVSDRSVTVHLVRSARACCTLKRLDYTSLLRFCADLFINLRNLPLIMMMMMMMCNDLM